MTGRSMASSSSRTAFATTQGQPLPSQPTDATAEPMDTSTSASVNTGSEYAVRDQVEITPVPYPPENIAQYEESVMTMYSSGNTNKTQAQQQSFGSDNVDQIQLSNSQPQVPSEHRKSDNGIPQPTTYSEGTAHYQQENYGGYSSYDPYHVNQSPQQGSETTYLPQKRPDGVHPSQPESQKQLDTTHPSQHGSDTIYPPQQGSDTKYPPQHGSGAQQPPGTSTHPPQRRSSYDDSQQWDGYSQQQYGNWNSYSSEYNYSKEGGYDGSYGRGSGYHEGYGREYPNSYNERGWKGEGYQHNYSGYQQHGNYPPGDYPPKGSYNSTREQSSYPQSYSQGDYYRDRQYGSPNYRDHRNYRDNRNSSYDGQYGRQYDSRSDWDRGYQSRQSEDSRHKDPRRPNDRPARKDSKDTFVERRSAMLRRAEGSKGKGKSSRGPQIVQPHRITESTDPRKGDKSKQLEASFPKRNLDSFKIPKKKNSSSAPSPVKKVFPIPALDVKEEVKTEPQASPQSSPLKTASGNANTGPVPGTAEVSATASSVPMDTNKPVETVSADVKQPEATAVKKKQAVSSSSKGKSTTTSRSGAKKNIIPSVLSTLDPKALISLALTMQKTIEQAEAEKNASKPAAPAPPPLTTPLNPTMLTPTCVSSLVVLPTLSTPVTVPTVSVATTHPVTAKQQPVMSAQSSLPLSVMSSTLATVTSVLSKSMAPIIPSTTGKSSTASEQKILPAATVTSLLPAAVSTTSTAPVATPPPRDVPSISVAGLDQSRGVLATVIGSQPQPSTGVSSGTTSMNTLGSFVPVSGASKVLSTSISNSLSVMLANALSSLPAVLQTAAKTTIANLKSQPSVEPQTSLDKLPACTTSSSKPPSSGVLTSITTDTASTVLGKRGPEKVETCAAAEAKRVKTESESEIPEQGVVSHAPTLPVSSFIEELDESQSKDELNIAETALSKEQAAPKSPKKGKTTSRKRSVSRSKKKVSASKHATSSSSTTVCSLCQKKDSELNLGFLFGPYKQTVASEPSQENGMENSTPSNAEDMWTHEECAVWTPGVCLVGGQLLGFQEAMTEAKKMVCVQCKGPGATLCCSTHKCKKCYHYPCAIDAKCSFDEERFLITCPKHSTTKE